MRRTKGQAAMEFLMTYGWAILAAIIVIGILGYYYFSSDVLTPKASVINPPFYLNAQNARTTGITLELKNNGGETYDIQNVSVGGTCASSNDTVGSITSGGTVPVFVPCALTPDTTFKGDITVTYRKQNSEVDLQSTGSMTEPVV